MEEFISRNLGNKEPGVIIVTSDLEKEYLNEVLAKHSFIDAVLIELSDLAYSLTIGTNVFVSSEAIGKDSTGFFDLVQGYASGAVRINDRNLSPAYESNNLILILPQDFIESELASGRDWLSLCGMALQYPI
jgi:hypothetical protein